MGLRDCGLVTLLPVNSTHERGLKATLGAAVAYDVRSSNNCTSPWGRAMSCWLAMLLTYIAQLEVKVLEFHLRLAISPRSLRRNSVGEDNLCAYQEPRQPIFIQLLH